MPGSTYSNLQRVAFVGLVIGFIMCLIGAFTPFWKTGELKVSDITKKIPFKLPGQSIVEKVVPKIGKFEGGIFYYCKELIGEKECQIIDPEDIKGANAVIILLVTAQIVLSLICGCGALCRMCCCDGGRTVCHGIFAFLAGGAGLAVIVIYYASSEDSWGIVGKIVTPDYGWSYAIYGAGAGVITIVSFILCFASPGNPVVGMVLSHKGGKTIIPMDNMA